MSRLNIGSGCSIGPRAVILYDSVLEDRVRLHALSLVMKGETLPADSFWCGAPAQRRDFHKEFGKIMDLKQQDVCELQQGKDKAQTTTGLRAA